ncbi:putative UDP-rhamnose:rhamnosyltransferase 1 [Acorus gramineus]|uniref:UDP-rhamnose:rhamnosyltransferase 1 n=1 Tax=Acorus gramineus TaxID=55184 RepID=A0AAV9BGF4_ACOGR|nr:putative UDP-rhamnose:rhamnosyltransferase 1 [Acorus gramineus]
MAAAADHDNDPKLHLPRRATPSPTSPPQETSLDSPKTSPPSSTSSAYPSPPRRPPPLRRRPHHRPPLQPPPPHLRIAYDALEPQLSAFLDSSFPDWLILDYAPYWAARARRPLRFLQPLLRVLHRFLRHPVRARGGERRADHARGIHGVPPTGSPVVYRPHEARELFKESSLVPDDSGVSEAYRFSVVIADCDVVAVRGCCVLERDYLKLLETDMYHKPVVPLGLLPPVVPDLVDSAWDDLFEWLERQKRRSVVYTAFGSEAKLGVEQVRRIAVGLDSSELPFVWTLRRPQSMPDGVDVLPEGFADPIRARGTVCEGWAGKRVGAPSVGGFLMHVGWNSIVKGLQHGRVLALLPLMFDQGLNARFVSERWAGVEVPRNEEDGSFMGEDIAVTLRLVMVEGEEFRAAAEETQSCYTSRRVEWNCMEKPMFEDISLF